MFTWKSASIPSKVADSVCETRSIVSPGTVMVIRVMSSRGMDCPLARPSQGLNTHFAIIALQALLNMYFIKTISNFNIIQNT